MLFFGGDTKEDNKVLFVGEDLLYEVKYSVFKIGTIRIKTYNSLNENGINFYETKAFIDSYEGLPFVDLHSIYYSKIFEPLASAQFIGLDKHKEIWGFTKYDFDFANKQILIQKGLQEGWKINFQDKVNLTTNVQDGLSLFFFARDKCGTNQSYDVPTFINEQTTITTINNYPGSNAIKINSVDYKIDCVKIDGLARFKGIFGLTGEFEGFFSNDEARVPIKAKMKVIIGNIYIELKSWKRGNWYPPHAK